MQKKGQTGARTYMSGCYVGSHVPFRVLRRPETHAEITHYSSLHPVPSQVDTSYPRLLFFPLTMDEGSSVLRRFCSVNT